MTQRLRLFLLALALAFSGFAPDASAGRLVSRGSSGGESFPDITAPGGATSFAVTWNAEPGADGYLVYFATATQTFPDFSLYTYRYKVTGGATVTKTVSSIASNTYYVRVAAYIGTTVRELSHEIVKVSS
jgi:hypothetical protein